MNFVFRRSICSLSISLHKKNEEHEQKKTNDFEEKLLRCLETKQNKSVDLNKLLKI